VGSECCDRLLRTPADLRVGIRLGHRLGIRHGCSATLISGQRTISRSGRIDGRLEFVFELDHAAAEVLRVAAATRGVPATGTTKSQICR
jgi:hypothetical protein